ncbi:MAG: type I methionyl aminopeptidase [Sandaracinaceae bacterium]
MARAIDIMTPRMVDRMRASCQMAARCLLMVGERIRPGITTEDINTWVHRWIEEHDATPSPLGYGQPPFPKSVCTSVNETVCHGIPNRRQVLQDGDIINVDVTTYYPREAGYHGDTSVTFYVGTPSEDAIRVVEASRVGLEKALEVVRDGTRIRDIGKAIQEHAESVGCSVVRDFVGHGVGRKFHMEPKIPHYYDPRDRDTRRRLKAGMVFTIEPMINLGRPETEVLSDQWTALTRDRSLSAQFEHSVLVTRGGCEVLTARPALVQNSEDRPYARLGALSCPAGFRDRDASTAETADAIAAEE